jgi:hypothetical protein
MFTDTKLTEVIEGLNTLAREYDHTLEFKLPVHNEKWMEHARGTIRAVLESTPA